MYINLTKYISGSSPESQSADKLTAQPGEVLLGRVLQVVGALVIDHHGQYEPRLHAVHVLCKATALVLAAVSVKPVRVEGGEQKKRGTQSHYCIFHST